MQQIMDVPQQALQSLQRGQQVLVITAGPVTEARATVDDIAELAAADGIEVEARTTNGAAELRLTGRSGRLRFISARQIAYGHLRGLSLDLVLHPNDKLMGDILPTLLTRQGLAVNYVTGTGAGPAAGTE